MLAKSDGQIRVLLAIVTATDEVISEEVIFGSTGTNDDFCDDHGHAGLSPNPAVRLERAGVVNRARVAGDAV